VLGDSVGAGIVEKLSKNDLDKFDELLDNPSTDGSMKKYEGKTGETGSDSYLPSDSGYENTACDMSENTTPL